MNEWIPWFTATFHFKGPFPSYMLLSYKNTKGQRVLLELLRSHNTPSNLPHCDLFFFLMKLDPNTWKHMDLKYLLHNKLITSHQTYKQLKIYFVPLIKKLIYLVLGFSHCGVSHLLWSCLVLIFSYNVIQRFPHLSFRLLEVKCELSHRACECSLKCSLFLVMSFCVSHNACSWA